MENFIMETKQEILTGLMNILVADSNKLKCTKEQLALGLLETVAFGMLIEVLEDVEEVKIGEELTSYSPVIAGLLTQFGAECCNNRFYYMEFINEQ